MRISVDDWHFREAQAEVVLLDVFLDNGQHGMLEINPMRNLTAVNGAVPEMIMFCEMPGERISEEGAPARRIARPPSRACPWSSVQLPAALLEQIKQRLSTSVTA